MNSVIADKANNVIIRPARVPDDVLVIFSLAEQTWAPTYSHLLSPEQLNYMFQEIYRPEAITKQISDGQQFLLLYQQQIPAGFASFSQLPENKVYKLNKLYVAPAFHGYGYGKLLIEAVQQNVRAAGGQTLELNVNRQNKAKGFYEKCGFRVARQEDIAIGPYFMNDYIMQKSLTTH